MKLRAETIISDPLILQPPAQGNDGDNLVTVQGSNAGIQGEDGVRFTIAGLPRPATPSHPPPCKVLRLGNPQPGQGCGRYRVKHADDGQNKSMQTPADQASGNTARAEDIADHKPPKPLWWLAVEAMGPQMNHGSDLFCQILRALAPYRDPSATLPLAQRRAQRQAGPLRRANLSLAFGQTKRQNPSSAAAMFHSTRIRQHRPVEHRVLLRLQLTVAGGVEALHQFRLAQHPCAAGQPAQRPARLLAGVVDA